MVGIQKKLNPCINSDPFPMSSLRQRNNDLDTETSEIFQPHCIFFQKNKYYIVCQAFVDSNYMFMSVSSIYAGSTHNYAFFLAISNMKTFIGDGNVPIGYWFAVYDAHQSSPFLLIIFQREFSVPCTYSYNYYQSSY